MPQSPEVAGSIYDLGYRHYEGARLGRRHAVGAVYFQSLRAAFGLGRRPAAKIVPIALTLLATLPAVTQLGIAAASTREIDVIKLEDYYVYIQILLALFGAAVAPELVGRDQRNRTLSLYFSRALERSDYALAKLAALTTAMLMLTLGPETILFVGNTFTGDDAFGYLRDNWTQVPSIVGSALFVSAVMSSVAMAIASQTPRRAYATGGVIAFFVISSVVGDVVASTAGRYGILISPFDVLRGATLWIFNAAPNADESIGRYDLPGALYAAVLAGAAAVSTAILLRRFARLAA